MQKVLLSFLIGCVGLISAHATTAIGLEGNTRMIQEGNNVEITPDTPPNPMVVLFNRFFYDPVKSALFIILIDWQNPFNAVLQNLSTGEHHFYYFDDLLAGRMSIPFRGGAGIWRLSLCSAVPHNPRILSDWYFTIENDIIMEIDPQPRWNF